MLSHPSHWSATGLLSGNWYAIGIMCISAQSHLRTVSAPRVMFCALVRRNAQNSRNPDMRRGTYRPVDALAGTLQREVSFRPPPYGKRPTSHFGAF
jgi:hypothetical protein